MIRPLAVFLSPFERLSIRAALTCAVLVTLALWLYTGYAFTRRLDDVGVQAAEVAGRYQRAQELLTTVRTQVLIASVRVRDGLLNSDRALVHGYREQIAANYAAIDAALAEYVPVLGSAHEQGAIERLRGGVDDFRATALAVLDGEPRQSSAEIRELLNSHLVPRREAAVRISEEVQALNRAAFLQQQAELTAIHRRAERQSLRRLGFALAASIGLLLLAWVHSGRLERRLRAQLERGAQLSRELQDATIRVLHAQEDERRTIARELHDEVGQVLTAVKVELGLAERDLQGRGLPVASLVDAQTITAGAIDTVRDITQLLHPAVLDDLGLVAATDAMVRGVSRREEMEVGFSHRGLDARLDPETEVAAYRIVQEALTNVRRHARAAHCQVELSRSADHLVVAIADDGVGFDVTLAGARQAGIGLIGIRERVAQLGGRLHIATGPGRGTRLEAALPAARLKAEFAHG